MRVGGGGGAYGQWVAEICRVLWCSFAAGVTIIYERNHSYDILRLRLHLSKKKMFYNTCLTMPAFSVYVCVCVRECLMPCMCLCVCLCLGMFATL